MNVNNKPTTSYNSSKQNLVAMVKKDGKKSYFDKKKSPNDSNTRTIQSKNIRVKVEVKTSGSGTIKVHESGYTETDNKLFIKGRLIIKKKQNNKYQVTNINTIVEGSMHTSQLHFGTGQNIIAKGSESNSTNSSTELRVLQRPPENTTNYFHYHIENLSAQHLFFDKEVKDLILSKLKESEEIMLDFEIEEARNKVDRSPKSLCNENDQNCLTKSNRCQFARVQQTTLSDKVLSNETEETKRANNLLFVLKQFVEEKLFVLTFFVLGLLAIFLKFYFFEEF